VAPWDRIVVVAAVVVVLAAGIAVEGQPGVVALECRPSFAAVGAVCQNHYLVEDYFGNALLVASFFVVVVDESERAMY
jgi:hypothetical protein